MSFLLKNIFGDSHPDNNIFTLQENIGTIPKQNSMKIE